MIIIFSQSSLVMLTKNLATNYIVKTGICKGEGIETQLKQMGAAKWWLLFY